MAFDTHARLLDELEQLSRESVQRRDYDERSRAVRMRAKF